MPVFLHWGLDSVLVNVGGQFAEGPRFESRRRKVMCTEMEFVNIYLFKFHPMLKYACVCCAGFVLVNQFAALW